MSGALNWINDISFKLNYYNKNVSPLMDYGKIFD